MNASFHILSNSLCINRPIIRHCKVEATDSVVNETKLINYYTDLFLRPDQGRWLYNLWECWGLRQVNWMTKFQAKRSYCVQWIVPIFATQQFALFRI